MNIVNNKKMDFQFIQGLFDLGFDYGKGWKSHYFREAQSCFEKHFTPLNKWRQNPNDSTTYGHFNDYNLWSWTNRINTHPNCCLSLYNWALKNNPKVFIDFGNPEFHEYNAKRMWVFADKYFDLIFTTKTTDKYYRELKTKCQKSWNNGNITMIAIIMSLVEAFKNVTDIEYTYSYGDGEDMNGVDLSFKINDTIKTMQIKSGKFINLGDEFHINGSPNDLKYNVDYYGYADVDYWKGLSSVIIFENTSKLYKEEKTIIVKTEYVKYDKIKHMPIPEKLNELLVLCGRNDIEFILKREDEINSVIYDNETKKIIINFIDSEDKEMETLLTNKIVELKETLK